jgi:hypothetical protein
MSYLAAVILKDRTRLIDIPTDEFDAAVDALWRKYHDAKAVLAVAKDQRNSRAPKQDELFELLVARAEGFRLPDGSFSLSENSIVRLFKNVLENDNPALIVKRTLGPMDLEDEIRGAAAEAAREARREAKKAEEAEREARRQAEEAERAARRRAEEAEREARRRAEEAEREARRRAEEARTRRLWFKSIPLVLSIVALSVVALPIVLNPARHSHKTDITLVRVARDAPCGAPEIHLTDFEAVDAGLIAKANRTILLAAHSLTDRAIIDALVAAQDRGVDVKLLLDPTQQHGELGRLRSVGNWLSGSQMLLELIVIDGIIVRTGSANFSQNGQAQPSDVVVEYCPTIAEKYASVFDELFEGSR